MSVFAWLAGEELTRAQLTPEHLESLGLELGKLHRVTQSFSGSRPNPYGPEVVGGWLEELRRHPEIGDRMLPHVGDRPLTLMFEPGRVIAGNAGVLLTRVVRVKR